MKSFFFLQKLLRHNFDFFSERNELEYDDFGRSSINDVTLLKGGLDLNIKLNGKEVNLYVPSFSGFFVLA
jgi:hypothetical protein